MGAQGATAMTPTLVPGHSDRHPAQGFSLIETLVVLSIVAIIAGVAGLGPWSSTPARTLGQDAARLARLFEFAHSDARAWNTAIEWRFDGSGYLFATSTAAVSQSAQRITRTQTVRAPFATGPLRARRWESNQGVQVRVAPPGATTFDASWYSGPDTVELSAGGHSVIISRTLAGQYTVVPATGSELTP